MIQDKTKLAKVQESLNVEKDIKSQKQTIKNLIKIIANSTPQLKLNTGYNKQILKPHNESLGIGITVHDDLHSIFEWLKGKKKKYVIQKLIENNICYQKRKFDLRVWTIITSTAPLVVWVYTKF